MERLKSKTTISKLFAKYVLLLGVGTFISLVFLIWSFSVLMNKGLILPANYNEKWIESHRSQIEGGANLAEIVPDNCYYGIYTKDGDFKEGNIKHKEKVWQDVKQGTYTTQSYFYKVFNQGEQVGIVLYKFKTKFNNLWLRKYIPSPEDSWLLLFSTLFIALFVSLAKRFSKIINGEMKILEEVTEKIKVEDLEFEIKASSIKEINGVLSSLLKLKEGLKESLSNQWNMERVRKEQIAALGHDLKTPLTILKGNAELLMETSLTEEQVIYGENILKKIEDLQDYIQALLEINYSETGLLPKFERVNTKEWLEDVIKDLVTGKNLKFKKEMESIPADIKIDNKLLKRALMNIIMNAIDYAPEQSEIFFSIKGEEDSLIFSVEDEGKGFSKEDIKRALEEFYRGDKSRNSKMHYGMGLYIAKKIAEFHGGEIQLENSQRLGGAKVSLIIKV